MQSRSCGVSPQQMNAQRAFKTVSEQGWGRLVPVKRRVTDKTRGGDRLRADAVELLERARSLDIEMIVPGDAGYPTTLEEFYDGGPPLLYARGHLALLESSTVALLSCSETSSQSLNNVLGLASRLA